MNKGSKDRQLKKSEKHETGMTDRFIEERKKEYYFKKAKKEGYRSRAAFKLLQINDKYHIIKKHMKVIDLGCAPGGWLQVTRKIVGEHGKVVGIDLLPVIPLHEDNVMILEGDMTDDHTLQKLVESSDEAFDVVLSDMAPDVSGHWDLDHERQIYLAERAFLTCKTLLKEKGSFVVKVFMGQYLKPFEKRLQQAFQKVYHYRPSATRKQSAEEYLICKGFKGREHVPPNSLFDEDDDDYED